MYESLHEILDNIGKVKVVMVAGTVYPGVRPEVRTGYIRFKDANGGEHNVPFSAICEIILD